MAEMRDAYGNPVRVDEYGNPVVHDQRHTAGGAGYGAVGGDIGQEQHHHGKQHHGVSGMLHRSGSSSSSSSSEDEGGVRRKKGVKERVKEKIPGVGHKGEECHPGATTYSHQQQQQYGQAGEHHQGEKKGVMEKIKEKLPGTHHH